MMGGEMLFFFLLPNFFILLNLQMYTSLSVSIMPLKMGESTQIKGQTVDVWRCLESVVLNLI